jgi:FHS family glucose/mannose:H+ symporter-like MFS transporter
VSPRPGTSTGTYLVHAAFVLTGVMVTLLGPMLPLLSARWALNDTQAGYLFTAQFAASILGSSLCAVLLPRYGYRWTLLLGLGLMAVAAGVLAEATWIGGLVAIFLNGGGFGIAIPAANLFVADAYPDKRASALNLLNFSWGIGAVGCPFVLAALQRSQHGQLFLYGMAGSLVLLTICFFLIPFTSGSRPRAATRPTKVPPAIWKSRLAVVLAVLFFLYVGTEVSLGGWVATYARRIEIGSQTFWAMTPSFFWGALLLGRATAPVLLRHVRDTRLASAGLALAALGVTVLLAATTLSFVMIGASFAGLGLASIYPINISLLSDWFGELSARIGGVLFAIAGLGGATLPWMVGTLSTRFGGLKVGLLVPLLGSVGMLALYLAHGSVRPQSPARAV